MADEEKPNSLIEGITAGFKEINDKNHKPLRERITAGFKENYENLSKSANVFGNVKEGISNDMGKFGMMLAPLQAIPGFSTIQALIQSSLSFIAKKGIDLLMKIFDRFSKYTVWNKLNELRKSRKSRRMELKKRNPLSPAPVNAKGKKGGLLRFLGIGAAFTAFRGALVGMFTTMAAWAAVKFPKTFKFMSNLLLPKNWKWLARLRLFVGTVKDAANPKNWMWLQKVKDSLRLTMAQVKNSAIVGKVKEATKFMKPFFKYIPATLGAAFTGIRTFLAAVLWPLTILVAVIKGMIDGFKKYGEQGFVSGLFAGLMNTVRNLLTWIVTMPADLVLWVVGWFAGLFGFDGVKEKLKGFSLTKYVTELFDNITQGVIDMVKNLGTLWSESSGVGDFMTKIKIKFKNMLRGILRSMLPDPNSSNMIERALAKVTPQGLYDFANEPEVDKTIDLNSSTLKTIPSTSGDQVELATVNQSEESKNLDEKKLSAAMTMNAVTSNNVVNNAGKKTYLSQKQTNADNFGYQLSYT